MGEDSDSWRHFLMRVRNGVRECDLYNVRDLLGDVCVSKEGDGDAIGTLEIGAFCLGEYGEALDAINSSIPATRENLEALRFFLSGLILDPRSTYRRGREGLTEWRERKI